MKAYNASDYVANIRAVRSMADDDAVRDGRAWYPGMAAIMAAHADETGLTPRQCAAIYAACSINTPWARNLSLAAGALADYAAGREAFATGGTLRMVIEKVYGILTGADIDTTLAADPNNHKLRSFTRNLSGDYDAVTVDRWAMRVAYGLTDGGYVPSGAEYDAIADAYRIVAAEFGETPADLQAITWCAIRGTGE